MFARSLTRAAPAIVLALALATAIAPAPAAGTAGGLEAGASVPPPPGGAVYGQTLAPQPVAQRFALSPRRLRADRTPRIVLQIVEPGVRSVRARIVLQSLSRRARPVVVDLGEIRTGRRLTPAWPADVHLRAGRYRALLHVVDPAGAPLARSGRLRGEVTLTVVTTPAPTAAPKPVVVAPAPPPTREHGAFPVSGPHSYGDGIGARRDGHTHQGVDILAAEGTPVIAPTAGTIAFTDYQRSGAGRYVVENADSGSSYFFAHCRTNSTVVNPGQRVIAGAPLCAVGHTGDAAGPHLHFEIWIGGWRVNSKSSFVDPLPQLHAWDR